MYKQSPSRIHRSKGVKVKQVLQICLLLAVCFWLIYQVRHSQEKRKEFDVKDGKVVGKVQSDSVIQRFGRKILPRVTELASDVEKHGEDEDEKEVEEEEEEEENKHEEDEPEKEDDKHEEDEPEKVDKEHEEDELEEEDKEHEPEKEDNKHEEGDGGRGDGDDEIDVNETENTDAEPEHEDESVDEDKEREGNERVSEEEHHTESEGKEDLGKEDRLENKDAPKEDHTGPEKNEDFKREGHIGSDTKSDHQEHEARDAQYMADDASSEVAQDIQTHMPETRNFTTGHGSEMFGKVNFGEGNVTRTDKDDSLIQSRVLQPREDVMKISVTSPNATVTQEAKYEIDSSKSEGNPQQNSTLPGLPNDHTENKSNSTANVPGEHSGTSLSNGTQTEVTSSLSQNTTGEGAAREGEQTSNSELAEVGANKTETVNSNSGVNPSNTTSDQSHKTNGTDGVAAGEVSSLHAGEKSNNNGTSGSDESSLSGVIQHDPIGQSNTTAITQEEKESRIDLGSLPKIQTEVQSNSDPVAE